MLKEDKVLTKLRDDELFVNSTQAFSLYEEQYESLVLEKVCYDDGTAVINLCDLKPIIREFISELVKRDKIIIEKSRNLRELESREELSKQDVRDVLNEELGISLNAYKKRVFERLRL